MLKKIITTSVLGASIAMANPSLLPSLDNLNSKPQVEVQEEKIGAWKSLTEAIKDGKNDNKLILVLVYSNTCPHCAKAINFLNQEEIYSQMSNKYHMVKLEGERDFIPEMFLDIQSVPAFFIINSDKQLIVPAIEGYTENESQWMRYLNEVSMQYKMYLQQNK